MRAGAGAASRTAPASAPPPPPRRMIRRCRRMARRGRERPLSPLDLQPHCAMMDTDIEDNVDRKLFRSLEKLRQLRIEHRDLDEVIGRLSLDMHVDELQLKRLKKRKLVLKDQITRLESELIPDLNA